ncbi:eCIS core domain-containing protein [Vibrio sp. WXL103]|uniref:eCIS core domain-containing protein n=1 Tax=Vibrio sp. WXL103 TaxID=3450710 RepID=UPI003EC883B5
MYSDTEAMPFRRRKQCQTVAQHRQRLPQAPALEDNRAATMQRKPNHTGLPDNLKSGMESVSGMSLDHVKVHYNSSKPAAVQAHAYAQGSDIHIASGQEQHLPHELGHVVQQAQGRVPPTTTVGGMAVNDNPELEKEADRLGEQALQTPQ